MRLAIKESDVQKAVMDYLAVSGIFHMRLNSAATIATYKGRTRMFRSTSLPVGAADILAFMPLDEDGWVPFWLEIKKPGGKQSDNQKEFQQIVERWGHRYLLLCSIDDAMRELKL